MRASAVTLTEQDCQWPEDGAEQPLREYTEEEISEALVNRSLTEDQCLYLHVQGISWQVQV